MIVFGGFLIVIGLGLILLRRISGAYSEKVHSQEPLALPVKAKWVEVWNLILGTAFVIGGVVAIVSSI